MIPRGTTIPTFQAGQPVLASLDDIAQAMGLPTTEQIQFISSSASSAIDRIEALADDGTISADEKTKRLPTLERELENLWTMLDQRAGDLPSDGDVSAARGVAAASRAAWQSYRDGLIPPLSQTDVDTPVDRQMFDAKLEDYGLALSRLADALRIAAARTSTWSGTVDDDGNRPEDGATVGAPAGTMVGGRLAEDLVYDVSRYQVQINDLIEIYGDTVAAAASANAAATYEAAAQTARTEAREASAAAESSRVQALGSANLASDKAGDASNAANAAAGSAATAITKAGEAGTFATSARADAVLATTKAGEASNSASQAAVSALSADGSSSSAASNAATSATARDSARLAAQSTIPDNFIDPANWANSGSWGGSSSISGGVMRTTLGGSFYGLFKVPLNSTAVYRVTGRHRRVNQGGGVTYLGVNAWNAAGADLGVYWFVVSEGAPALNQWATSTGTVSGATLLAWAPTAVSMSPFGLFGYPNVSDAEISQLRIEDVTSEVASGNYAAASANSSTSAAASQNGAASSASAARDSEINAGTKAAQAGVFAGQAGVSETNAAGSSSSAAANALVAASAAQSRGLSPNADFTNGLDGWYWDTAQSAPLSSDARATFLASYQGRAGVLRLSGGFSPLIVGKRVPIDPSRKYRVPIAVYVESGSACFYAGVVAYDAAGNQLTHSPGSYAYASMNDVVVAAGSWQEYAQNIITGVGTGTYYIFPVGTCYAAPLALPNYPRSGPGSANPNPVYIDRFFIEDVTESQAAAGFASAAASSASSASASESATGANALSASNSANTAGVKADSSSASASSSAGSAAAASASAASALQNMRLSASVGARSVTDNPTFADWPASGFATSWLNWNVRPAAKTTGLWPSPNAVMCDTTGGAGGCGIYQTINTINPGRYVAELDIELVSGSIGGIGCLWRGYNGATQIDNVDKALWQQPDINGVVRGENGGPGMYRWAVPFDVASGVNAGLLYVVTDGHWSNIAKKVKIHRVVLRPANAIDLLPATVSTLAGAVADMYGQQSAFLQSEAAVAGSSATAFVSLRANVSAPAAAPLTPLLSTSRMVAVGGRSFHKTSDDAAWRDGFISNEAYAGSAWVQGNASSNFGHKMIGLTDQDALDPNFDWVNLDYAFYFQDSPAYDVRESGSAITGSSGTYGPNVPVGIRYTNDAGGTISYFYGGVEIIALRKTGVGTNRTFRAMGCIYNAGSTAGLSNIVFGPSAPSQTSSVALGAQEILLVNQVGSLQKIALKLANGNAAFGGDIYAGGKIIMGNGNTGWEIAVKPKLLQVTDGQAVSWANLGYIPSYTFSTVGLAPLGAGESYAPSLDNLSSTGATVRLKINVPGTPSSYNLTVDAAGGTGAPARVMSKGGNPDANGGQYRFQGNFSASAYAEREGPGQWTAYIDWSVTLYAKVGGTWTAISTFSDIFVYYDTVAGLKTYNGSYDKTVTAPAGVTDFGATGTRLASVSWTSPGTGSSVRSATPNGQTCQLTITP